MTLEVKKFGGSSVNEMALVGDIIEADLTHAEQIAVVSAFSGVTDKLLAIYKDLTQRKKQGETFSTAAITSCFEDIVQDTLRRASEQFAKDQDTDSQGILGSSSMKLEGIETYCREYIAKVVEAVAPFFQKSKKKFNPDVANYVTDKIVSIGEVFSAHVLAVTMTARSKIQRIYKDINLADILAERKITQPVYKLEKKKEIYDEIIKAIRKKVTSALDEGYTPILTGYVGAIPGGILDTIDRGYTDSTAAMTAVALKKYAGGPENVTLQIWKEVDGLLSADPKIVGKKNAQIRRKVSYKEAGELAAGAGMKAINSNGIFVLDKQGITLEVRNTFHSQDPGTVITDQEDVDVPGVRFVSGKKAQTIYTVSSNSMVDQVGVAEKILKKCRKQGIAVDAITTSATEMSFSIQGDHPKRNRLEKALAKIGNVEKRDDMALVCCIGNSMRDEIGLIHTLTGVLKAGKTNIEFDCGSPQSNVTFIIKEEDFEKTVKALHEHLFPSPSPQLSFHFTQPELVPIA